MIFNRVDHPKECIKTHKYICWIPRRKGKVDLVIAVGLDCISSLCEPGSLNCLKDKFNEAPEEDLTQAYKEVNLLIGLDNWGLHPQHNSDQPRS